MTVTNIPQLLFLHGFLQNGKVFSEKSSGIRKLLKKANIQCDYIDGPVLLEKKDLPFEMDDEKWKATVDAQLNRAWFYHSEISSELDVAKGIETVVDHIKKNGPYDGIVGFSQGAALSTIITNMITQLVPGHPEFKVSVIISGYSFTEQDPSKPEGELRITEKYQESFTPGEGMKTKIILIYGEADQAVPSVRSKYLASIYESILGDVDQVKIYEHPGGHMIPNKKDIIRPIVEEIEKSLQN